MTTKSYSVEKKSSFLQVFVSKIKIFVLNSQLVAYQWKLHQWKPRQWHPIVQELVVYAAKSKKVMYSITFVILPVTKTIFCTRGCFSASLGLKMNIDSLSWPYGHLRLSNLSFPALVTLENNHSYQKLFPTLGK